MFIRITFNNGIPRLITDI
uniref:Uncharacterized protein n=1 Tax=Anguilla anguilla TaxID=7936 RepID=A0A0E9VKM2_ANGAN